MKLSQEKGEMIMRLNDREYTAILGAMQAAALDTSRNSTEFINIYKCERDDIVIVNNRLRKEDQRLTRHYRQ
jgi:hypothetical protein